MDFSFVYMKSDSSPDEMKPLDSCGTGIDHEHIPFLVSDDLQDVGMATDEDVRTMHVDQLAGMIVILAGIAADMRHEHLQAFAFEDTMDRMDEAEVVVVAVSGDSEKGLESTDLLRKLKSSAEVSGMPDLVHRLKKIAELPAEYAVGV